MLKARMKYGAVDAKVLALYGKLFSDGEWSRLYECTSIGDIAAVLRGQRGWSDAVSDLAASPSAAKLKSAARNKVFDEYEKLYKFSYLEDKGFILFFLSRVEYGFILGALRSLYSGEYGLYSLNVSEFLKTHSKINVDALSGVGSYSQLLEAARGSMFENTLKSLPIDPETQLPRYRDAGIALENRYYSEIFSYVTKKYNGTGKKKLEELLGTQADILNLVSLLRLLRHFPDSLRSAQELLVPISHRLTPTLQQSLKNARSETEALDILRRSRFAKLFEKYSPEKLDTLYDEAMSDFCRKLIKMPEPNLCVVAAYLTLGELESARLIRLIEAVDYGVKLNIS